MPSNWFVNNNSSLDVKNIINRKNTLSNEWLCHIWTYLIDNNCEELDFIPLLHAMSANNYIASVKSLLYIWKRGYTYEDILESFQMINTLFGNDTIKDNVFIHKFLIHAWISYCKGHTSILALQHMVYKTLHDS